MEGLHLIVYLSYVVVLNGASVIDTDYMGELKAILFNPSIEEVCIPQEQCIIQPMVKSIHYPHKIPNSKHHRMCGFDSSNIIKTTIDQSLYLSFDPY